MITSKLQQAVNDQITAELWSSNLYLQMSYYLKHMGWDGFAHWMKCHSDEEREHATRMADYLTDRGGQVKLQMVNLVPEGWGSVLEIFEHSLSQEKMVSKMIDKIVRAGRRGSTFRRSRGQVEDERGQCASVHGCTARQTS